MSPPYDLFDCTHFTCGAVGEPGERVFFLQAGNPTRTLTLRCEKQQVAALADYFERILADLALTTSPPVSAAPFLRTPLEVDFLVGSLGIGYDNEGDRLILAIEEAVAEGEAAGLSARWAVGRTQARAFAERARLLMQGGRPLCPLCGLPVDPNGHTCPKTNGHLPH